MNNLKMEVYFLVVSMNLLWSLTHANQIQIEYPLEESKGDNTMYEFVPVASIVGFGVIGLCFFLLIVVKLMFASSNQYMLNNRYDLIIYKTQMAKNPMVQQIQLNSTSSVNAHNLNAALASGFDMSMLNKRNSLNSLNPLLSSLSSSSTANHVSN